MLKQIGHSPRKGTSMRILSISKKLVLTISRSIWLCLPKQTMEDVKINAKAIALDIPPWEFVQLDSGKLYGFMNPDAAWEVICPRKTWKRRFDYVYHRLEKAGLIIMRFLIFPNQALRAATTSCTGTMRNIMVLGRASGYVDGVRYKNRGPIRHSIICRRWKRASMCRKKCDTEWKRWKKRCFSDCVSRGIKKRFEGRIRSLEKISTELFVAELTEQGLLVPDRTSLYDQDIFRIRLLRNLYWSKLWA